VSLRLPEEEYAALCKDILQRDHWKCRSCGSRNNLHCHHIIFRSQGGEDTMENILVLCSACHDGVHKDVKDGQYALVIVLPANANAEVQFIRRPGWRPQ
jgi:5-methylcytosine-specific restriction endonuclease McrA